MCHFWSLLVPFSRYFLLSYTASCHSVFIPQFFHPLSSLYSAVSSRKSKRTHIKKCITLMTLLHAETLLLFCLTPAPDEVFWKGRKTRGYFLEMPFSWMYLLYTVRTTPLTRVTSKQHVTCSLPDDTHSLHLNITVLSMLEMPVLLVGLEVKVKCFSNFTYAKRKRSRVRCQNTNTVTWETKNRGTFRPVYGIMWCLRLVKGSLLTIYQKLKISI